MEFLSGSDGPIIPDPEIPLADEHLERTQTAMDFFRANAEHMRYFKQRAKELGRTGRDTVIALINVDDPLGGVLADRLMPGHDWQSYRDVSEVPVAQGLALKSKISGFLQDVGYETAASELTTSDALNILVLDAGVALVLDVEFQ